jgi:hypothetical protein
MANNPDVGIGEDDAAQTIEDLAGVRRDALLDLMRAFKKLDLAYRNLQEVGLTGDAVSIGEAQRRIDLARDVYGSAHDRLRFVSDLERQTVADRHAEALNRGTWVLAFATIALVIATVVLIVVTALGA